MNAPLSPRRLRRVLVAAVLVLLAAVAVGVSVGPAGVGVPDAPTLALRGGRVLVALLVGAALATTGAALQALLRNGLADPYVLGVSGGAALGAAAMTALSTSTATAAWLSWWGVPAGGVAGAAAASGLLLLFVARGGATRSGERTVLVGVVLNAFAWAFVAVVRAVLPASATQTLSVWLIGAVAYPDAALLPVAFVATLVGTGVVVASAGALRLLRHGDDEAARLGVDVPRVRAVVVAACSLLVGVAVATTGVIGFVGLLVPHALRRTVGADERVLIPAAALGGAALLVLLDACARGAFVVVGGELPVGALCALFGAPGFAWLLWRQGKRE